MLYLYLIRHGETKLNAEHKIRAWSNPPLNADGRKKAKLLHEAFMKKPVDKAYSSDLKRAVETANTTFPGKKMTISSDFRPLNVGDFTGMKESEVLPTIQDYIKNKPNIPLPGGEAFNTFKKRFLSRTEDIINANPNKSVAIVAHHRNERLLAAWIKNGMKPDFSIDINEMLKKGIDAGEFAMYKI